MEIREKHASSTDTLDGVYEEERVPSLDSEIDMDVWLWKGWEKFVNFLIVPLPWPLVRD